MKIYNKPFALHLELSRTVLSCPGLWCRNFLLSLLLFLIIHFSYGQGQNINGRERMQSLFLYNFASKYIDWPMERQEGDFIIGVYGESKVILELETVTAGKKVRNQNLKIKKINLKNEIEDCHILFVPFEQSDKLYEIANSLGKASILIVTDKEGSLIKGSDINFLSIDRRLKFETNLVNIKSKNIYIDEDLLKLSVNTIGKGDFYNPVGPIKKTEEKTVTASWQRLYNECKDFFNGGDSMDVPKYKSALLSFLTKEVSWPTQNELREIKVGVLCNSSSVVYDNLLKISRNFSTGLPLKVHKYTDVFEIYDVQLLYISPEISFQSNFNLKEIIAMTKGSNTLVVTDENSGNDNMINFKLVGDKPRIEVNRDNIEKVGLKISNELLLLGDVNIKTKEKAWEELYSEMEKQLREQHEVVKQQKEELGKTQDQVDALGQENVQKQALLIEKTSLLSQKEKEIEDQIITLQQMKAEIKSRETMIKSQQTEMVNKQKQISEQDQILNKQLDDINKQKFIIYSATGMFVLAIGFVFFMVRSNRQRHKAYRIISAQKELAEKAKKLIEEKKEELEQTYKNSEALREVGQKITSTLDLESIFNIIYENVKELMDASIFIISRYKEEEQKINTLYIIEKEKRLPNLVLSMSATNSPSVWCIKNKTEIVIGDMQMEYSKYFKDLEFVPGTEQNESLIMIPLIHRENIIGTLSVGSFNKNAYSKAHLEILRLLASFIAIAINNASAFQQLKNTQSQLVQSEKMASLGQLTAGVAHEINNPINFVSAGIDSVRQNYSDIKNLLDKYASLHNGDAPEQQLTQIEIFKKEIDYDSMIGEMEHLLKSIKNGAMRTTEIVKSLRNFSRLDEYALKKANLHDGIDSTLTILTNKFKNRIEIVKNYGNLPEINCFPGQLNQVFMNILNNSIDAIIEKGTVVISTTVSGNFAEVRIKDNGKGMAKEIKQKIFEPFFTTKNVGEGTGLGLSISYGIIEKHKGSIQVESKPGKGTEFIIQIPMNLG